MNNMRIRTFALTFVAGMICLALLITSPVLGNDGGSEQSQTWPSRTPTSTGPGPTQEPPAPATIPGQTPVASAQPGLTPGAGQETPAGGTSPGAGVATLPPAGIVPVASPDSESILPIATNSVRLPSAVKVGECGFPPLVLALGPTSVRSGPGIESETIGNLVYQDERPIVGRAATTPWWLIQLSVGQQAWVSDLAVSVVGYTGAVPVIASSGGGNGGQPLWEPTPNPLCTPPAQETLSAGSAIVAAAISDANGSSGASSSEEFPPVSDTQNHAPDDQSPGFSLLKPDDASFGTNLIWLPVVGAFLILAGGIALLMQRRQS